MNSEVYIFYVLETLVHIFLPKMYPEELQRVYVHHDAAPSHTSAKTTEFLKKVSQETKITFIQASEIPVKSPDASPLDFFGFGFLKQRLRAKKATTIAGLRKVARSIWSEISTEAIINVYESWRKRLFPYLLEYYTNSKSHKDRAGLLNGSISP